VIYAGATLKEMATLINSLKVGCKAEAAIIRPGEQE
jgi:hypothetical protein